MDIKGKVYVEMLVEQEIIDDFLDDHVFPELTLFKAHIIETQEDLEFIKQKLIELDNED